ncbi:MAG: chloride channel protein [Acutalibacteraceae bacterium]|nr:chloride channel protein [Acutalibacteraceae bacterium]
MFTKLNELIKRKSKSAWNYIQTFVKWVIIALITGSLGGIIGTLFSKALTYANEIQSQIWWLIFLLPVGGIIIVTLYKLSKMENDPGTNCVIESIRNNEGVPWVMAPLIFISTAITHLLGGSAGREGAALQLGGSLGSTVGKILKLDEKDMHLSVLCGMSGLFSSLFCTPVTATLFAVEVISVGVTYYSALVPCLMSAIVSYFIAVFAGVTPTRFDILKSVPELTFLSITQVITLSATCAVVSILFCVAMHKTPLLMKKLFKNEYVRVVAGGCIIVALTFLVCCRDYNSAGSHIIAQAINGEAKAEAFLLKIIFTAITIGSGYKGGEIVPTLFIGSTFGCVMGGFLGLDPSFGAAMGMVCLFCGVVNCPLASIMLSIEVFGAEGLILFAVGCAVSYMLSGYYGLYSSQKILYSKLKAEFININAK